MASRSRHERRRRRGQPSPAERAAERAQKRNGDTPPDGNEVAATDDGATASDAGVNGANGAGAKLAPSAESGSANGAAAGADVVALPASAAPPKKRRGLLRRRDREPREPKPKLKKLRTLLVLLGLCVLAFVSWVFGIMMAVAQDLPELENRAQYERAQNSTIVDAYNKPLATLTNNEGRILIPSEQIAPSMKEAAVAIEDQRFYEHSGVDFKGIGRAVFEDITSGGAAQGASTITQQFVKNALEAQQSRTVFEKLREAALAYHLERQWSKDKILTEYLNSIYFGEGAYGIEAAATTFFSYNHPGCGQAGNPPCASQLLPWESALLAAVISSPEVNTPRTNPQGAKERRDLVLQKMSEQGDITPEEEARYVQQPLPTPGQIHPPSDTSNAPYFTSWLRQQLVDRYGAGEAFGGGLTVKSTLDLDLQDQVNEIAANRAGAVGLDTSIVVLDNQTGGVRAMYGGADYNKSPFNLATNGHRQPGSSFKPFTLITALKQGHSPDEVYASGPKEFPFKAKITDGKGRTKIVDDTFHPSNYEGNYLGSASITTATTYSDNSVYAELGLQVGPENVAQTANDLGIDTDLSSDTRYSIDGRPFEPYNPALILGGLTEGVTTLEMAHAYETVAEDGNRISGTMASSPGGPVGIIKVTNQDGDDVEDKTGASGVNEVTKKQEIDPAVAASARDILTTVVTSGTGKRAQTSEPTWGKTGTTDNNGDAWFVGSTPDITVAIWVGHADSVIPMETEFGGAPVDGGTIPAETFADIVNAYLGVMATHEAENPTDSSDTTDTTTSVPTEAVAPVTTTPQTAVAPAPTDQAPVAPADEAPATQAPDPAPTGGNTGAGTAPAAGGVGAG
jgi:penicillin-binding protein 1A